MTIPEDRLVALSQLRSGDLPPEESAALRAQIELDPALAAAWRRLGALEAQLTALPNPPPPAALRRRVVRTKPRWPVVAALAALAAAAALALSAPGAPPATLTLLEGHQDVVGAVDVVVPGGTVTVDGHARVRVEPRRAVPRRGEAEDPMKSHLLAAAGGAVVTVAVLRGTAVLTTPDDAPPIEVPAGTTRVVQIGAPDAAAPPTRPAQVADRALDPAVAQYVADLEAQVASLTLQNTFVSGQLAHYQGEARPFPADAHPWISPEGFKEHVSAALASVEGLTVRDIDCDEYPCIAVAQSTGTEEELRDLMQGVSAAMKAAPEGELNTMISADMSKDDDDPAAEATLTLGVALLDAANPDGEDLGPRIQQRLRDAQEALSDPR